MSRLMELTGTNPNQASNRVLVNPAYLVAAEVNEHTYDTRLTLLVGRIEVAENLDEVATQFEICTEAKP